jgi:hypothetical protein
MRLCQRQPRCCRPAQRPLCPLTVCARVPTPAEEIAKAAQGKYYYLPNASDAAIASAASNAMLEAKAGGF